MQILYAVLIIFLVLYLLRRTFQNSLNESECKQKYGPLYVYNNSKCSQNLPPKQGSYVSTSEGWMRVELENICKHKDSVLDNDKNILYDRALQKEVGIGEKVDLNEVLENGKQRYFCKCNGTDYLGNPLIEIDQFPHACFANFCKVTPNSEARFNSAENECNCGERLSHRNHENRSSPCIPCSWSLSGNTLIGSRYCYTKRDPAEYAKYYPPCENFVYNNHAAGCKTFTMHIAESSANDYKTF